MKEEDKGCKDVAMGGGGQQLDFFSGFVLGEIAGL